MTVLGSSSDAKRATLVRKSNEFDLKLDVLGHNDGTGFVRMSSTVEQGKFTIDYNRRL